MKIHEVFPTGTSFCNADYTDGQLAAASEHILKTTLRDIPLEDSAYELRITSEGVYALYRKNLLIGWIKLAERSITSKRYKELELIYIVKSQRKTLAFFILVNAIRQEISCPILVSGAVFSDGVDALNAISRRDSFEIYLIDLRTGELKPYTGVPFNKNLGIVIEGFGVDVHKDYIAPGGAVSRQSYILFK